MKRILPSILCGLIGINAFATSLQKPVDKLINQVDPNINMGIEVVDLNTGETLYQRNATRLFVPASNMKLFSDAAALLALGPDYRFKTELSTDAPILEQGILKGSIYLYLPGDPSFTQNDLNELLSHLASWGVTQIQGDVVLVSDHNVVSPYAPGWVAKDLTYSYGAPLAPLMLDENRLTVTVNPAYRAGEPALVEYNALNGSLSLDNQVKTMDKTKGCGIDYRIDGNSHLTVRGCVGVGQWAVQQRLAIRTPLPYAQEMVKLDLERSHIKLNGQVKLGSTPSGALLIATHTSKPIAQLMADTLKPSDNLYADSLYLHVAAKLNGKPVNWDAAQPIIKQFLQQQTGIPLQNAVLTDGSGLSRQDRLTPEQTVNLLKFLHNRFPLAYEYIAALPVSGRDGTLQRRLRKPAQQGLVRAKTGSMTGVVSLSGYLYTANAHTLAFAIFVNTTPGTHPNISGRYRYLVDSLCDFFLHQRPDNVRVAKSQNPFAHVAFQNQPTQAEQLRAKQSKWRKLEYAVKHALQNQPITVVFRNDQLLLIDHGADVNKVWAILQDLRKKSTFAVSLQSQSAPNSQHTMPTLLWVKSLNAGNNATRTWAIQEAVS